MEKYKSNKVFGEWVKADFDDVVSELKSVFSRMAQLEDDTPEGSIDELMRYFHPEMFEDEEENYDATTITTNNRIKWN